MTSNFLFKGDDKPWSNNRGALPHTTVNGGTAVHSSLLTPPLPSSAQLANSSNAWTRGRNAINKDILVSMHDISSMSIQCIHLDMDAHHSLNSLLLRVAFCCAQQSERRPDSTMVRWTSIATSRPEPQEGSNTVFQQEAVAVVTVSSDVAATLLLPALLPTVLTDVPSTPLHSVHSLGTEATTSQAIWVGVRVWLLSTTHCLLCAILCHT